MQDLLHQFKESSKRATFFISRISFGRALSPKFSICPDELSENLFFQVMVFWGGILACTEMTKRGGHVFCHARSGRVFVGGTKKGWECPNLLKPNERASFYSATQEHVFVSILQYAMGVVLLFSQTTHGHSSHAAFCVVAL